METLIQDVRYGLRQLRKSPGFTATSVVTLALGIAVNSTMFSMVSAFLLRRPPGRDPERMAVVCSSDPSGSFQPDANPVSVPNYLAWREANHVFSDMAAADEYRTASLTTQRQSEALHSAAVTANYFAVFGVSAELGRTFQAGEDQPGQAHVVVLSHELWETNFGSDASLIGRTVRLNREPYTVIGVMPASFHLLGFTPKLWTPLVLTPADQTAAARRDRSLRLFGRLKPDASLEQARAEIVTLAQRGEANFPDTEKGWGATVRALPDFLIYRFGIRNGLFVVMTTVGFVLMIACANVAGLLLARAAGRKKELAIRRALGAGRLRVMRQLLTEGGIIAFLGGSLGLGLASWGINFVRASMQFSDEFTSVPLALDRNVLVFTAGVSLFCAVLCAMVPAFKASRTDINSNLKDESRSASASRSHTRLRTVMVTSEIALALLLLIGTGLLFVGIFRVEHQNLGFQPDHLLTANVTLDSAHYKDASLQSNFVRDLTFRLQQIPGALAVAMASDLPATGPGSVTFRIQGQEATPNSSSSQGLSALDSVVTTDFFRTASISLLRGRTFTEMDGLTAPRVVVVNQKFVERYLQDQDPIGKQLQLEVNGAAPGWSRIIGVVGNVKPYSETSRDDPAVYEAFLQRPISSFAVMIRTASDPNGLASATRKAVSDIDGELPLAQVMSMDRVIDLQKGGNPFFVRTLAGFGFLALAMAAVGIYGLIAYSVGQRTQEIGIRMALGARRQDVLRLVFFQGMKMTIIGGVIGITLSLPLPKIFAAIFYDLHVAEPGLYILVPVVILAVATLATCIPALRAARVEPMTALHQD